MRLKGRGQGHVRGSDSDYVGEACLEQRFTVGNLTGEE